MPRDTHYPLRWMRLCEAARLPYNASINQVHAACTAHVPEDQRVGRGTIQRIREGGEPRSSSVRLIADALGVPFWSLSPDAPNQVPRAPGMPPPPPPAPDFSDRRIVAPSDWALLQDMHDAATMPQLRAQIDDIRRQVQQMREFARAIYEPRLAHRGRVDNGEHDDDDTPPVP